MYQLDLTEDQQRHVDYVRFTLARLRDRLLDEDEQRIGWLIEHAHSHALNLDTPEAFHCRRSAVQHTLASYRLGYVSPVNVVRGPYLLGRRRSEIRLPGLGKLSLPNVVPDDRLEVAVELLTNPDDCTLEVTTFDAPPLEQEIAGLLYRHDAETSAAIHALSERLPALLNLVPSELTERQTRELSYLHDDLASIRALNIEGFMRLHRGSAPIDFEPSYAYTRLVRATKAMPGVARLLRMYPAGKLYHQMAECLEGLRVHADQGQIRFTQPEDGDRYVA